MATLAQTYHTHVGHNAWAKIFVKKCYALSEGLMPDITNYEIQGEQLRQPSSQAVGEIAIRWALQQAYGWTRPPCEVKERILHLAALAKSNMGLSHCKALFSSIIVARACARHAPGDYPQENS